MKAKLIIFTLFFQLICWNTKAQVSPSDSLALVALANSTSQPFWFNSTNWLTGTVDTWYGITVNAGRVTEIDLSANSLFGPIPPEIGDLDAVTHLNLSSNSLLDSIPSEIGNMIALTNLNLSNTTNFVNFPTEMGNLVNLEILNLSGHRLRGLLPAAFANLINLRELDLSTNISSFSGLEEPLNVSMLTQLELLNLAGNRFRDFPDLTTLPSLTQLFVENNLLEFDDIELNLSIPTFTYIPQRISEVDSTVIYLPGDNLQLDALIGGSSNTYQWYKDSVAIAGATNPTFDILSATSLDGGSYYCEINSTVVPGLTISSRGFYVVENPYNTSPQLVSSTYTFNQLTTVKEANHFVMSLNLGDVNDDGLVDFGFLFRDKLQIFFGGPFHQTPDLEILADPLTEMHEVRAADYTGDGFMDIAISSGDINDAANTSKLDFYYGSQLLDINVDHVIQASDINPISELGNLRGIHFNTVGDVNNDGIQDFLINLNNDELYLYFGGNTLSTTPDQILTGYNSDFGVPNLNASVFDIGNRISPLGDVNGDGIDDFAVSDYTRNFQVFPSSLGVVIIHFGKAVGQIQPDMGIALTEPQYSEVSFLGISIEVGNINNDGFNDILIAAVRSPNDSIAGNNGKEMIFVYHGGPALDNIPDMAQTIPSPPFEFENSIHMPFYIGEIIAFPDVTNDGKEEFYFGSWGG